MMRANEQSVVHEKQGTEYSRRFKPRLYLHERAHRVVALTVSFAFVVGVQRARFALGQLLRGALICIYVYIQW